MDHSLIQVELDNKALAVLKAVAGCFLPVPYNLPVPYFPISSCSSHRMEPVVKINAVFWNSLSLSEYEFEVACLISI